MELTQLGEAPGAHPGEDRRPGRVPAAWRSTPLGRAKRRRALLDQLSAGDDLDALSTDIDRRGRRSAPLPPPPSAEAKAARETLERLKDALSPSDALVCALLLEDDASMDDVATWSRHAAEGPGGHGPRAHLDDRGGARNRARRRATTGGALVTAPDDKALEYTLRQLGQRAGAPPATLRHEPESHVDEPILALFAVATTRRPRRRRRPHRPLPRLSRPSYRGRAREPSARRRRDRSPSQQPGPAPQGRRGSHARLVERGHGRWTAVVDADQAEKLKAELVRGARRRWSPASW